MSKNTTRIAIAMTATALVASLASPMVAGAVPGARVRPAPVREGAPAASEAKAQRLENLKKRISNVLKARKARFDAVTSNLNMRIDRLGSIADRVEKAGGDVDDARASIDAAKEHLAKAESLEQDVIDAFEAIPSATNKGEAFREARAKARLVHAEFKTARDDIRAAAKALRAVVQQLKSQATQ